MSIPIANKVLGPTIGPLSAYLEDYMEQNGDGPKKQVKFYLQPRLDDDVENFVRTHRTIPSKSQMGEWALKFYMDMFERSGGMIDGNGFPAIIAEQSSQYTKRVDAPILKSLPENKLRKKRGGSRK